MEYVISPIWMLLEHISILFFLDALLPRRLSKQKTMLLFLVMWASISIYALIDPIPGLKQFITIGIVLLFSLLAYQGFWVKHVLYVCLPIVFIGIIDTAVAYGTCALLKISYNDFIWKKLLFVTVTTVAKLVELFLAYLFFRLRKGHGTQRVRKSWLLLTLLFPLVSLMFVVICFVNFQNQQDISVGTFAYICLLAVANIAILYLIHVMEKRTKEEQQLAVMNQQMEIQTKSILALEKSHRAQRKSSHEFMHQMQTISALLSDRKIDEAQTFVQEIQGLHTTRTFPVNTHHPIIDAILNQKYQLACDQDTEMIFQVNDLSTVQIETSALVVLFSNLLDNALEACQRLSDCRQIQCKVVLEDSLLISIRNTSLPVIIQNGHIETTKTPKEEHGFGLSNVRNTLDRLNGEYVFAYNDGWFQFAAEIPHHKESSN